LGQGITSQRGLTGDRSLGKKATILNEHERKQQPEEKEEGDTESFGD